MGIPEFEVTNLRYYAPAPQQDVFPQHPSHQDPACLRLDLSVWSCDYLFSVVRQNKLDTIAVNFLSL